MMPLGLTGPNQSRTVLAVVLISGMLLLNGIIAEQPDAEARTISLTSAQIEKIMSRMLPMLDRADQRWMRLEVTAIRNSHSKAAMSYLDPAYQDNPVYTM